jgi:prepilin-type processing-associated H-X9-DG protein
LLAAIVIPVVGQAQELARRTKCRTNVKGIANACIQYMDDDTLHRDSLGGNSLPRTTNSGTWGTANPAALWMLMKPHKFVGRETFLCPSAPIYRDDNFRVPDPEDNKFEHNTLSYSYLSQVEFTDANPAAAAQDRSTVTITTRSNPGLRPSELAIIADANPCTTVGLQGFNAAMGTMNSPNHDGLGQNVAFMDGHVGWFASPIIPGTKPLSNSDNPDNIYLPCNSGGSGQRGAINDAVLLP